MGVTYTLLSLDMSLDDCLYRFRRDVANSTAVVYVDLKCLDIISEDSQTYGPGLIKELWSYLQTGGHTWITLTVFRDEDGIIQSLQDQWKPLSICKDPTFLELPSLDVLSLNIRHEFKHRVFLIDAKEQERQILKLSRFDFELEYLAQEMKAYHTLSRLNCDLIPRMCAYVFEQSRDQVMGFICEEIQGRAATPADYSKCRHGLEQLHRYNVLHGDINKYNMIITSDGVRFLDLEKSVFGGPGGVTMEELFRLQKEELDTLASKLQDDEGWGKPW